MFAAAGLSKKQSQDTVLPPRRPLRYRRPLQSWSIAIVDPASCTAVLSGVTDINCRPRITMLSLCVLPLDQSQNDSSDQYRFSPFCKFPLTSSLLCTGTHDRPPLSGSIYRTWHHDTDSSDNFSLHVSQQVLQHHCHCGKLQGFPRPSSLQTVTGSEEKWEQTFGSSAHT